MIVGISKSFVYDKEEGVLDMILPSSSDLPFEDIREDVEDASASFLEMVGEDDFDFPEIEYSWMSSSIEGDEGIAILIDEEHDLAEEYCLENRWAYIIGLDKSIKKKAKKILKSCGYDVELKKLKKKTEDGLSVWKVECKKEHPITIFAIRFSRGVPEIE